MSVLTNAVIIVIDPRVSNGDLVRSIDIPAIWTTLFEVIEIFFEHRGAPEFDAGALE